MARQPGNNSKPRDNTGRRGGPRNRQTQLDRVLQGGGLYKKMKHVPCPQNWKGASSLK